METGGERGVEMELASSLIDLRTDQGCRRDRGGQKRAGKGERFLHGRKEGGTTASNTVALCVCVMRVWNGMDRWVGQGPCSAATGSLYRSTLPPRETQSLCLGIHSSPSGCAAAQQLAADIYTNQFCYSLTQLATQRIDPRRKAAAACGLIRYQYRPVRNVLIPPLICAS